MLTIRAIHSRWRFRCTELDKAYTILVPVPADMPVFTKIALSTILAQDLRDVCEVLVIPDQPSADYRRTFGGIIKDLSTLPVEVKLLEMGSIDRWIGRAHGTGNCYHFLQLINGIEHSRGAHLLFHDADLFIAPGDTLRRRFEEYLSRGISVFGVTPRTGNEERPRFVATWEMLVAKEWLKRFKPHQMRGQIATVNGKTYPFDTTHLPQFLSDPSELESHGLDQPIAHYNYVITNYREFEKAPKPYDDNFFRILLIRFLVDALDNSGWPYRLPSFEQCVAGLSGTDADVNYADPRAARIYPHFRRYFQSLLELGLFERSALVKLADSIAPFDQKFGWVPEEHYRAEVRGS